MAEDANRPDWEAIRAEIGVEVRSAALLGEGWSGWSYRVSGDLVFKFLKHAREWAEIDREVRFLDQTRPLLALPVADHLHQVRRSDAAPCGYAVYRYLAGQGAKAAVAGGFSTSALAANVARFLRALHALEVTPELEPLLPREVEGEVAEEYRQLAETLVIPGLSAPARARLRKEFDDYLDDPANFPGTPRIIHADLSADHILCDGESVTGVLDWGDVCVGDPDYDFSYLYGDFGEAFVRELAGYYEHPDPDRLIRKAHYYWIVDQIDTVTCSNGRAPAVHVRAARRRLHTLLTS